MKKQLAIFSGMILALGLSSPAWAQLGHLGVGADANVGGLAKTDVNVNANDNTRLDTNAKEQGNVQTNDSVKAKKNKKDKTNADAQAGNSANGKGKKQKHQKDSLKANSDTRTNEDAYAKAGGANAKADGSSSVESHERTDVPRR